jgi:hypothetical protein
MTSPQAFSAKAQQLHAQQAHTRHEPKLHLHHDLTSFTEARACHNLKKTPLRSSKTGATHRHNCLQMIAMQQPSAGPRWTKKGRRSKKGARAITTGSPAHLWLPSAPVHSSPCRVSQTPLYKGVGNEKRNQRATKRSGRVQNGAYPLTTQHPTTAATIYSHATRFCKIP